MVAFPKPWRFRGALIVFVTIALALARSHEGKVFTPSQRTMRSLPRYVLWAWERPEDLRFLDPQEVGVAFLAASIDLKGGETCVRPRLQPLRVADNARLIAVVRIAATSDAALSTTQLLRSLVAVANASTLPRVVAVQLDFDATTSQRAFYRDLLLELRRRLPAKVPVSITALASWCLQDDWISGLPIDEAVPMLFRMGAGTNETVSYVASGRDFHAPVCRDSLGISTDERWASLPTGRRLYVFRPKPWTQGAEMALFSEVRRWH